jgi:hypothetical protein
MSVPALTVSMFTRWNSYLVHGITIWSDGDSCSEFLITVQNQYQYWPNDYTNKSAAFHSTLSIFFNKLVYKMPLQYVSICIFISIVWYISWYHLAYFLHGKCSKYYVRLRTDGSPDILLKTCFTFRGVWGKIENNDLIGNIMRAP